MTAAAESSPAFTASQRVAGMWAVVVLAVRVLWPAAADAPIQAHLAFSLALFLPFVAADTRRATIATLTATVLAFVPAAVFHPERVFAGFALLTPALAFVLAALAAAPTQQLIVRVVGPLALLLCVASWFSTDVALLTPYALPPLSQLGLLLLSLLCSAQQPPAVRRKSWVAVACAGFVTVVRWPPLLRLLDDHVQVWRCAWRVVSSTSLGGEGLGNYGLAHAAQRVPTTPVSVDAGSTLLCLSVEQGVLVMLAAGAALAWFLRGSATSSALDKRARVGLWVALALLLLVDGGAVRPHLLTLIVALAGAQLTPQRLHDMNVRLRRAAAAVVVVFCVFGVVVLTWREQVRTAMQQDTEASHATLSWQAEHDLEHRAYFAQAPFDVDLVLTRARMRLSWLATCADGCDAVARAALVDLDAVVKRAPKYADAQVLLGELLLRAPDVAPDLDALDAFEAALDVDPGNVAAYRGALSVLRTRHEDTRTLLEDARAWGL